MKRFLGLLVMLMIIASNCLAMTFSQPVKIGEIIYPPVGEGMIIKNATYTSNKPKGNFQKDSLYPNDTLARFSDGENSIYVHHVKVYNVTPRFGDENINNTIPVETGLYGIRIFQVKNDSAIKFYLLVTQDADGRATTWSCIGKKGSQWIKYFDTRNIRKKYLGDKSGVQCIFSDGVSYEMSGGNSTYARTYCKNDTIVMEYRKYEKNITKRGEFRFKWDESAQWFGVEQVVY